MNTIYFFANTAAVSAVPEQGVDAGTVETIIDALTTAAAFLPMPWSAIAAGALGLAGTIWAWKKRGNKKGK